MGRNHRCRCRGSHCGQPQNALAWLVRIPLPQHHPSQSIIRRRTIGRVVVPNACARRPRSHMAPNYTLPLNRASQSPPQLLKEVPTTHPFRSALLESQRIVVKLGTRISAGMKEGWLGCLQAILGESPNYDGMEKRYSLSPVVPSALALMPSDSPPVTRSSERQAALPWANLSS